MVVPRPKPCYLDELERWRVINSKQTWRSHDKKRLYQWDDLHGEIEGYDKRGYHVGVYHAVTGELIEEAIEGRKINVS